jgi:hypothetical protein
MRALTGAAIASVAAIAAVLVLAAESERPGAHTTRASAAPPPRGVREDCSTRSEANFPGAFTDPRNLIVGPLVLMGGSYTSAATVRQFGGNKFPLLVKAGHRVTVSLPARARAVAGLAYGPLPQGEIRLRDTHQTVTFVACQAGRPSRRYRPGGPSGSYADGVSVTFWSGFVLARTPSCVPLHIYVDDEPSPRRVGLSLGRRCAR